MHSPDNIPEAMRDVLIALVPALLCRTLLFPPAGADGHRLLRGKRLRSRNVCLKVMKKEIRQEYSAIVTGLLLAFCLPPTLPVWMAALGSIFAIVIAKHLFGGLGQNIFNPALIGRAFLLASFPVAMTRWTPARRPYHRHPARHHERGDRAGAPDRPSSLSAMSAAASERPAPWPSFWADCTSCTANISTGASRAAFSERCFS